MVGPNFQPPTAPTASQTFTAPGDAPPPADQPLALGQPSPEDWWRAFHAPALDALITEALANNPDVDAAKARVAEAEETLKGAQGAMLPQLNLGATAGRQKYGASLFGPLDFTVPPFTYYVVGPSMSFPLDLFGGQRRTVEEAGAFALYRRREADAVRLQLASDVAATALALATARSEEATVGTVLADDRRNLSLAQTSFDLGSGTRTQMLEAQNQLAEDQTFVPPLHEQEAVARHALALLVGKPPQDFTAPDLSLSDFTLPGETAASLPSELIHRRPDILAAEAQLHMASAAVGVATADLYPKIVLNASYTQQALTPGGLFNASAGAWSMAAGLTQPLFDGGRLRAQKRAAGDRYDAAMAGYRKTVLAAFGQVADALQAQADDADLLHRQTDAAQVATQTLDIARRSYAAGATGVLDVINAQRSYARAQIAVTRAQAQRLADTVKLESALGAGAPDR